MLSKEQILTMAERYDEEHKNAERVPVYYKRNGEFHRRSYDDVIYSDLYRALQSILHDEEGPTAIFKCDYCKKTVCYGDLEAWACDFEKDDYICAMCYEEEMGEDL